MMSRVCYIFMVACLLAVLIFAVQLRIADRRIFYKCRKVYTQSNKLQQQYTQKRFKLEALTNPKAILDICPEVSEDEK